MLRFSTARPALYGLEMHLVRMHHDVKDFKPDVVVIDPLTSLAGRGRDGRRGVADDAHGRLLQGAAHHGDDDQPVAAAVSRINTSDVGVSSLTDTWIVLRDVMVWLVAPSGHHHRQVAGHGALGRDAGFSDYESRHQAWLPDGG